MQDRFKLRIFDKKQKKIITVTRHFNFGVVNGTVVLLGSYPTMTGFYNKHITKEYDDVILMQCTGLKDKTGKLIYEGDIVKDLTYSSNVKYVCAFLPIFGGLGLISNQNLKDYEFCKENWESYRTNNKIRMLDNRFKLANQGNKLKCFNMNNLKMDNFEVIGNIYESPELLKDGE